MLSPVEALTRDFELPQQSDQTAWKQEIVQENFHGLIVGDLGLLLASDRLIIEIVDTLPLCRLPNAPLWLHAMANHRGNITPIYDLTLLFDQPRPVTKHPYYLIAVQNQDQFGIVIDRLPEKIALQPRDFIDSKPPLPSNLEPFIHRTCLKDGRYWLEWEPFGFIESVTNPL